MARVSMVEREQASSEVLEIYKQSDAVGARVINLQKVMAHNHYLMRNVRKVGASILLRTSLPPKLRELSILRVGTLLGSEYELAQHYPLAKQQGITEGQIKELSNWKNSQQFNDIERIVLKYTDMVTQSVVVDDDTFQELSRHFNEKEIVELTTTIGYFGMIARILIPLQIEVDPSSSAEEIIGRRS
jgi:4-carboxymuconolactone decarboxylase